MTGNDHHTGPAQDTELPEEVLEQLFGDSRQPPSAVQGANPRTGAADEAESILQSPASAEASAGSSTPDAPVGVPRVRGANSSRSKQAGLKKTVDRLLGRFGRTARAGNRNRITLPPSRTAEGPYQHTAGGDSLAELERRMKISLRETSLANIARVGVGSPKGGVGKSSTAYGVAGALAYYSPMRVVLVDADPNFGSTRLIMPRPIDASVVDLARDADDLEGLSDLRGYIAQNEKMRLDVVLGPTHAYELADLDDLGEAYERIDRILARHYDVIVYDLGLGFRDPAIQRVLSLCNELLFVSDSEVIPNAMLEDGVAYIRNLGVDLERTTLVINHRLPAEHESADTAHIREAASKVFRRVTDIPYDDSMSQLINRRAFHIESLWPGPRRGILTTVAAACEGLMKSVSSGAKVSSKGKR